MIVRFFRRLGRLIDAEDREFLAQALVLGAGAFTIAVTAAATLGLSVRIFLGLAGL